MQRVSKVTAALLGAIVLIGVYQAQNTELLTLVADETILAGAANIIMVYFVLALLVERACEVAMDLLTAAGAVKAKDASAAEKTQSDRRMVSIFVCLVFSIVISLAGLRLVEMILEVATASDIQPEPYFAAVDALLTSLILAGGSDGIHQILRSMLGDKSPVPADT